MNYNRRYVICFQCTNLINPLWECSIKIESFKEPSIHIVGYNSSSVFKCNCCGKNLKCKDLYFESKDDFNVFVSNALKKIAAHISKDIYCCNHCSGNIIESLIYSANKGEPNDLLDERGTYINELLSDYDLPEAFYKDVADLLVCQECGYGSEQYSHEEPGKNKFHLWEGKIYYESVVNRFWGWDVIKFANKYDILINEGELEGLKKDLYKNSMLALSNETGAKLYSAIKENIQEENFIVLSKGEQIYRGRVRYKDEREFQEQEMWSPPSGVASHGRYNTIGKSVLYCSNMKDALPYELHPTNAQVIDIVTLQASRDMRLFDMDAAFEDFEGFTAIQNSEGKVLKGEYLLTNFIGSCCEHVGYDGIRYSGVGNSKLGYYNYALFDKGGFEELFNITENIEQLRTKAFYKEDSYHIKSLDEMLSSIV
ncbi:RES domain-containing protein [Paenibacillus polymyxa]|uniref:RES domain-containing protein n=1 Tax=Paenibacillus polymyxa TaxID=1406 RepID=UPI002AB54C29|nr:RES domain-containing protein [Paenibacillus polymyxa]MDY8046828.1 RES domain-containing protein [Paenibacillus polymyxa]